MARHGAHQRLFPPLILTTCFGGILLGATPTYTVTPIPLPAGWGAAYLSSLSGINDSGQFVGTGLNGSGFDQAFIGSDAGSTAIPGTDEGRGINNLGQVAGDPAFIGTASGITAIPPPIGWPVGEVDGINNLGQIVGTVENEGNGTAQAFIGTPAGSTLIPLPAGNPAWFAAFGNGINNLGQVVGEGTNGVVEQAFIGTTAGSVAIPLPVGQWLRAQGYALNDSGQVVGVVFNTTGVGQEQAFIGTAVGSTTIPLPVGWSSSLAYGINNSGEVVGSGSGGGFVWDATNGSRDLNRLAPAGWTITDAIAINNKGQIAGYGENSGTGYQGPVILTPTACPPTDAPCITNPKNGAQPQSQFVALSGTGTAGHTINVQVDSVSLGSVVVDSEGNWEALTYISPLAFGTSPAIQAQDQQTSNLSNVVTVQITDTSFPPGPVSTASFLPLRHADIFVDGDPSSAQEPLYGPNYTHTALYLGGDADGNPWLAEAVTPSEAGIWGQVRALPLNQSLVWNALAVPGSHIAAFTPQTPLPDATRDAIVSWANTITKQGLPYWNASTDFLAPILSADAIYVATLGVITPRFTSLLNLLNANKNSTTKFICSTLVWRAYWEGTGHTLDLSSPNLMSAAPGSDLGNLPSLLRDSFIQQLDPVLVVPETFVRSPKLKQIF